jgi:cytochrome P450
VTTPFPPGPRDRLPFRLYREYSRDTLGLLRRLAGEYGDVVGASVCGQRVLLLGHPDHIQDVLVTQHRTFDKANVKIRYLMGQGLSAVEGEEHKQQRHLLQPAFLRDHVRVHAPVMVEQAARLGERWQHGATADMNAEMMRLTQTIVGKALFDSDVASETEEVTRALTDVLETPRAFFTGPLAPLFRKLPLRGARRIRAARGKLHEVVAAMIADHRRPGLERKDLLAVLVRLQQDHGGKLSDDMIRDNVLNLFLAGHETSANGLTWCWYLLARHPEVQDRLHVELDRVLAGRPPSADDVPALTYTEQTFAEALRLYPPVWTIVRTARADCEVAGYRVRAGTTVLMSQYVVQRDARFYLEPERFDPEHMAHEARAARPKFAYFPFGGGPRQCIGESFAWLEAILVLATLAQQWRVRLASDAPVVPEPRSTLRPKGGMPLRLERRGG